MIVPTTRKPLHLKELSKVFNEELSDRYSYKIFDPGMEPSIIIQKSALVGDQVTLRENEIVVDGTFPSVATSFLMAIISASGIWLASLVCSASRRNLENDIAILLRRKYS